MWFVVFLLFVIFAYCLSRALESDARRWRRLKRKGCICVLGRYHTDLYRPDCKVHARNFR